MVVTSNPYAASPHQDVLCQQPDADDVSAKLRLIEEIKTRAKGAFSRKDYLNAELLYSRAIELISLDSESDTDKSDTHLLFANRAAVRLSTSKNYECIEDCDECLKRNKMFVKAWFRKATALMRLRKFKEGISCVEEGIKTFSDQAESIKTLETLKKDIESAAKKDEEERLKFKEESQKIDPNMAVPVPTRAPVGF